MATPHPTPPHPESPRPQVKFPFSQPAMTWAGQPSCSVLLGFASSWPDCAAEARATAPRVGRSRGSSGRCPGEKAPGNLFSVSPGGGSYLSRTEDVAGLSSYKREQALGSSFLPVPHPGPQSSPGKEALSRAPLPAERSIPVAGQGSSSGTLPTIALSVPPLCLWGSALCGRCPCQCQTALVSPGPLAPLAQSVPPLCLAAAVLRSQLTST